jgi:hypothetical protein
MLLEILNRTPIWVFVLFAVLLAYGLLQTRTRELGWKRVALTPAIFMPLSLWGVWAAFGPAPLAFGAWVAGAGAAVALNRYARAPRQVSYSAQTRLFRVAGSWVPLAMMMAIFFMRYATTVAMAMQPALQAGPLFSAGVGAAYGLMSGSFLARALHILASATKHEVRPIGAAS